MKEYSFGRSRDCDIVFDNEHVSSHHGCLIVDGAEVYVVDNNSTNGTYVNGQRIRGRVKLSAHDRVALTKRALPLNWEQYAGIGAVVQPHATVSLTHDDDDTDSNSNSNSNFNESYSHQHPRVNDRNVPPVARPLVDIPAQMEINQNHAEVYRNGEKGADWKVPLKRNLGTHIGNALGKTIGCLISAAIVAIVAMIIFKCCA